MSEEPAAAASGLTFQEIDTGPPERTYRYRPLTMLTYLVTGFLAVRLS
jgi:hypothetical protein